MIQVWKYDKNLCWKSLLCKFITEIIVADLIKLQFKKYQKKTFLNIRSPGINYLQGQEKDAKENCPYSKKTCMWFFIRILKQVNLLVLNNN